MKTIDIDATKQTSLTADQINFFKDKGFIVIRNGIAPVEIEKLRVDADLLIEGMASDPTNDDYWWNNDIPEEWYKQYKQVKEETPTEAVKRGTPFRVEYPIDKSVACKTLLGHAFVLRAIEQLLGTKSFIPTWDSLVFKAEGDGVPIKWHRDASAESAGNFTAIDVGFYLDSATVEMDNCLWVIPGSNKWPDFLASQMIDHLIKDGFKKSGAIPVPVAAGDIIFHDILLLHGSPACKSPKRRTVYFEYRSIQQELVMGPHVPEYIPLKQRVLVECLQERSKVNYDQEQGNHTPYHYQPDPPHSEWEKTLPLTTLRFPHKTYFRADYKG